MSLFQTSHKLCTSRNRAIEMAQFCLVCHVALLHCIMSVCLYMTFCTCNATTWRLICALPGVAWVMSLFSSDYTNVNKEKERKNVTHFLTPYFNDHMHTHNFSLHQYSWNPYFMTACDHKMDTGIKCPPFVQWLMHY